MPWQLGDDWEIREHRISEMIMNLQTAGPRHHMSEYQFYRKRQDCWSTEELSSKSWELFFILLCLLEWWQISEALIWRDNYDNRTRWWSIATGQQIDLCPLSCASSPVQGRLLRDPFQLITYWPSDNSSQSNLRHWYRR
jgi:hypothetical protein